MPLGQDSWAYASTMPDQRTGSRRETVGSWIEGPRGAGIDLGYPGQGLGLPESGPGSVARFGLRLAAFTIDAAMCAAISWGFTGGPDWVTQIFLLEVLVLTLLAGGSAGQIVLRLRVVRLDGSRAGVRAVVIRTALLALIIPAIVWDRDQRGLHDKAAGTVLLKV